MVPRDRRGFRTIEHTADLGLLVWAPTLEELFAEAAVSLVAVMGSPRGGEAVTEEVSLVSRDRESLFVDWLSEVLFLFDARAVVPKEAGVRIDRTRWTLEANIEGVRTDDFVQTGPAVKAVTHHALELTETQARVYLDV